jgi:hypothetical protein
MNTLGNDWPIKPRANACAQTHRAFEPGEQFYTLLFREGDGFRREDLSEQGWAARNENIRPFSFWKTRYEPSPAPPPEPLAKESAEGLLRRLLAETNPAHRDACYVLAAMLERKRVLKQVKTDRSGDEFILVYEHAKTGEVFLVRDAQLKLADVEHVQREVAGLLQSTAPE